MPYKNTNDKTELRRRIYLRHERQRRYRCKHRKGQAERVRKWKRENKDKVREWARANREYMREYMREYHQKNKEKINAMNARRLRHNVETLSDVYIRDLIKDRLNIIYIPLEFIEFYRTLIQLKRIKIERFNNHA